MSANGGPCARVRRGRIGDALACGAAAGTLLTALSFSAIISLASPSFLGAALPVFVLTTIFAAIPWFLGALLLGGPIWMLGEKLGWTSWWMMTALGALTPFTVIAGIHGIGEAVSGSASIAGWAAGLGLACYVGAIGAVVGLVAHYMAYCR